MQIKQKFLTTFSIAFAHLSFYQRLDHATTSSCVSRILCRSIRYLPWQNNFCRLWRRRQNLYCHMAWRSLVLQRSIQSFASVQFGSPVDIPQPTDFDVDGKAELSSYRPSNGFWYLLNLLTNQLCGVASEIKLQSFFLNCLPSWLLNCKTLNLLAIRFSCAFAAVVNRIKIRTNFIFNLQNVLNFCFVWSKQLFIRWH